MAFRYIAVMLKCISFCLTADESMKVLFNNGNGSVLKECLSWLSSGDEHLEISGCLALGNFGRSGKRQIRQHCRQFTTVLVSR